MVAALVYEPWGDNSTVGTRAGAPIQARADASGASPLAQLNRSIARAGTGGVASAEFYLLRPGYLPFVVVRTSTPDGVGTPYAGFMAEVKAGFGRTMSRLPEVFGVSRQTLYNWLNGDSPKAQYEQRIEQLAHAARAFDEKKFKPTTAMLDRTVSGGKSFLQLMSEGANGRETAEKLVRIVQRGAESRSKLDALLAGRKPSDSSAADFGTPSFKEVA